MKRENSRLKAELTSLKEKTSKIRLSKKGVNRMSLMRYYYQFIKLQ